MIEKLLSYDYGSKGIITKEKGIYDFDQIKEKRKIIPLIFDVHKIIIFGSYATSKAHELSDIDIVIDTSLTGFSYFELFEYLQKLFMKTVDLVRFIDLDQSSDIFSGIKHKGILIYKQK